MLPLGRSLSKLLATVLLKIEKKSYQTNDNSQLISFNQVIGFHLKFDKCANFLSMKLESLKKLTKKNDQNQIE